MHCIEQMKDREILHASFSKAAPWSFRERSWAIDLSRETRWQQDTVPVIASECAKEFLQSENVSYFDHGGSLFLADRAHR